MCECERVSGYIEAIAVVSFTILKVLFVVVVNLAVVGGASIAVCCYQCCNTVVPCYIHIFLFLESCLSTLSAWATIVFTMY